MTLSDPEPQVQGHSMKFGGKYLTKSARYGKIISGALCVYDEYTVSEDNITTFSNDTNVARSLGNR